ncbi:MAG: hypothetical protein ACI837_002080 [Crocinitomicaceae bacterium]|jgi:hypothetical protein
MKNWFKSNDVKSEIESNINPELYNWKYLDISELSDYPDLIKNIYDKEYDGVIIRNVFSEEEIAQVKERIEGIDKAITSPTGVGHSYPRIFAQMMRPKSGEAITEDYLKDYFTGCEKWPSESNDLLGLDFSDRIESTFKKISGDRPIEIPKGYNGIGSYLNSSIRVNYPGKGFIMVHCGNYFQQEFSEFYDHLTSEVNVKDQLSYFVTVNPAEKGGELTLFDLLWEEGQTKRDARADNLILLADGSELDSGPDSPLKRQKVSPGAGDLLIFSGGPIWHKVELVEGNEERITMGGFLSFTSDYTKIKYWT